MLNGFCQCLEWYGPNGTPRPQPLYVSNPPPAKSSQEEKIEAESNNENLASETEKKDD